MFNIFISKQPQSKNWFLDDEAEESDESGTASEDWEANSEDDAFLNDDEDFEVGHIRQMAILISNILSISFM